MKTRAIGTMVLLVASSTLGRPVVIPHWEFGKATVQQIGSDRAGAYVAPLGAGAVAIPLNRAWSVVTVEAGDYRYLWVEENPRYPHVFVINESFRFYRDGDLFVVMDQRGKHTFRLTGAKRIKVSLPKPEE